MPIRPPRLSTRNISVITFGLSTDKLITQLLITTSTDPRPRTASTPFCRPGRPAPKSPGLPDGEVVEKSLDASRRSPSRISSPVAPSLTYWLRVCDTLVRMTDKTTSDGRGSWCPGVAVRAKPVRLARELTLRVDELPPSERARLRAALDEGRASSFGEREMSR